jgi:dephospho-CoA kinase
MILGITGSIACGKSIVARLFGELGAAVVSADELARDVIAPGSPLLAELRERFGPVIVEPNGTVDRKALAAMIFSDHAARRDLNRIMHPAIAALAEARLKQLSRARSLVVYEAPLLFEAGAEGRVDAVLVVRIEPQRQLERLMARDGVSEAEARSRIAAQMPQDEKIARADFVIDNSGSLEGTQAQVRDLFACLRARPSPPDRQ